MVHRHVTSLRRVIHRVDVILQHALLDMPSFQESLPQALTALAEADPFPVALGFSALPRRSTRDGVSAHGQYWSLVQSVLQAWSANQQL